MAPVASQCGSAPGEGGHVLPGSASELREMANEAARSGDHTKAVHLYTMAIDVVAKGMPRDKEGKATDANLLKANRSSDGELAKLLSNRSHMYLKQGDLEAAIEDAQTCTRADPAFEKGHLRLAVALEAAGAPVKEQLGACERGLEGCPDSQVLVSRKWRLKKAVAQLPAEDAERSKAEPGGAVGSDVESARRIADDPSEPRRAMAAADLGSIFAVGAYGLEKDVVEAEKYLRIGCDGGDVGAQRNLGLLLLELGRVEEALVELRGAMEAGDEQAAATLQQLQSEAQCREQEAMQKLEELAAQGDARAVEMLKEFSQR